MSGCGRSGPDDPNLVRIEGSSVVEPLAREAASLYIATAPGARIPVRAGGTTPGIKSFCREELDIVMTSRPIKASETISCGKNGVKFIEIPVAYDGIAVIVNRKNRWTEHMTRAELSRMWQPGAEGQVTQWAQIRSGWPKEDFKLFGPMKKSGAFEAFTKKILGKAGASRVDFKQARQDIETVTQVASEKNALGYVRLAAYMNNRRGLRVVPLQIGDGEPVEPSVATIRDGTYKPLSRELFIYVNADSADRVVVDGFVKRWLGKARAISDKLGYVPLPGSVAKTAGERYLGRITGMGD
jgi:phosphate transport system substrate-binding protein